MTEADWGENGALLVDFVVLCSPAWHLRKPSKTHSSVLLLDLGLCWFHKMAPIGSFKGHPKCEEVVEYSGERASSEGVE